MFDFVDLDAVHETAVAAWQLQKSTWSLMTAVQAALGDGVDEEQNDIGKEVLCIVQERCKAAKTLAAQLHRHHQIPFCMGSGATTLEHKCRAIAQKSLTECADIPALQSFLARVVAIVVDMGVERGVADAEGGPPAAYLPGWLKSSHSELQADEGLNIREPMLVAREDCSWSRVREMLDSWARGKMLNGNSFLTTTDFPCLSFLLPLTIDSSEHGKTQAS